jgi:oligoribonuclease (3'-5' exoribonuclease)
MTTGIIKTNVRASSVENAKKIGAIFKNIAEQVSEKDLMSFYDKIQSDKQFLAKVIKKLDSPLVKSLLG